MPAARVGDMAFCVGPPDVIAKGSVSVFIGGMPAARMGDMTAHGGVIVVGCPTVLIGDMAGAGGGPAGPGGGSGDGPGSGSGDGPGSGPDSNSFENATAGVCSAEQQITALESAAISGLPFCPVCNR